MNQIIELDESGEVGTWVPADRVSPLTNIYGRRWLAPDGRSGAFYPDNPVPRDIGHDRVMWFFPAQTAAVAQLRPPPKKPWWRFWRKNA